MSPFKSQAQREFLFAKHPKVAKNGQKNMVCQKIYPNIKSDYTTKLKGTSNGGYSDNPM